LAVCRGNVSVRGRPLAKKEAQAGRLVLEVAGKNAFGCAARLAQPQEAKGTMSLFWKLTIAIVLVLLIAAFIGLSIMAGSPKDAYGMVRYAFPHMHRGNLKVGDDAPDARLVALDGANHFHIRERTGARPLVIIFGSYT
jgi:hypothetical protein